MEPGSRPPTNRREMRCAYHPDYYVPLPPSHPFPMAKYPLLFERLRTAGLVKTYGGGAVVNGVDIQPRLGDLRCPQPRP